MAPNGSLLPYVLLVITALFWGVAWAVGRMVAVDLPAMSIAALRYAIVVPCFFLLLHLKEGRLGIAREWIKPFLVMGLLSATFYQAFFLFGMRYTAGSDAALVIGIGPILIAFLATLALDEKMTRWKALGLLLGFAGIAVIAQLSPNVNVENRLLGDLLILGGAVVYALYTIYLRRFQVSHAGSKPSSLRTITWVSLFGWLPMLPFAVLEQPWNYAWTPMAWAEVIYLAIFSTVIAFYFYVAAVARVGASSSAVYMNLVPVFGVLSSALLLGEAVSVWHGLSFALILLGVWLAGFSRSKALSHGKKQW